MRNLEPFPISSRREHGANITFRPPLPLPPPSPPPLQVMPHNQVAATHSALPSLSNFTVQSIVSFIFTLLCVYNILTFFYSQLHLELLPPLYMFLLLPLYLLLLLALWLVLPLWLLLLLVLALFLSVPFFLLLPLLHLILLDKHWILLS
jgi:hypothetical protein